MKNLLIAMAFCLLSLSSYAKTTHQTIRTIENSKEAKCRFEKSSHQFCFGISCYRWVHYRCTPDNIQQPEFGVRLREKVVEYDGEIIEKSVTSIKFK